MIGVYRSFPLLTAARGDLEEGLIKKLQHILFSPDLWILIPRCDVTNRTNAILFQSASSALCSAEVGGKPTELLTNFLKERFKTLAGVAQDGQCPARQPDAAAAINAGETRII